MNDFKLVAGAQPNRFVGGAGYDFPVQLHRHFADVELEYRHQFGNTQRRRKTPLLTVDGKTENFD